MIFFPDDLPPLRVVLEQSHHYADKSIFLISVTRLKTDSDPYKPLSDSELKRLGIRFAGSRAKPAPGETENESFSMMISAMEVCRVILNELRHVLLPFSKRRSIDYR